MGICIKCGKEDTLVRGLCSECLALEMEQEALEDVGDSDELYMEKHDGEIEMTVENLKRQALAYQPNDRVVLGEMKDARKEYEERLKNYMNQAGLFEDDERVKYRKDIENLINKYGAQLDSGEYRICKASLESKLIANKIVDTSRGLVVYSMNN